MKKQQYSTTKEVIGGKSYHHEGCSPGNHVWVHNRYIRVEFDSDYYISKKFSGKNWLKVAVRQANKIPNPVTVEWFVKNGYSVPKEIQR